MLNANDVIDALEHLHIDLWVTDEYKRYRRRHKPKKYVDKVIQKLIYDSEEYVSKTLLECYAQDYIYSKNEPVEVYLRRLTAEFKEVIESNKVIYSEYRKEKEL